MIKTNHLQISLDTLNIIAQIDEFKGAWRALGTLAPERLSALRQVATIESIGSSTRIEGSKLSDREVKQLLSNLKIKSFNTRDEQEVAGYAEVMELIFQSWENIPLTENHIKQLHCDLLIYSQKDERHRGEYKKSPNSVAAFDENGKKIGIVFETATPFETPRLMTELIDWYNAEKQLHSLLIIGIFIVVFLEIHPFQDGNGRLSRILTTLLLLQAGYARRNLYHYRVCHFDDRRNLYHYRVYHFDGSLQGLSFRRQEKSLSLQGLSFRRQFTGFVISTAVYSD
jgi:Fic family protein